MMIATFQQLRLNERGVAAIELALIAPILAALIMGAVDVGSAYSRKLGLEQGAQRAVEKIMQTTEMASVQGTIASEVALQANVTEDQVKVTFPRYCSARLMPNVDEDNDLLVDRDDNGFAKGEACAASETEAHYIMIEVGDEYEPMFPALGMGTKLANGNYRVEAKAGMRTK